ncbi:MAG: methyl-accepting chemotaxis protein [Betaproteobacteria bacterium]|nr:methyl-accepting chemotaxis protein [Betaproteobacteria bacterium]
MNTPTKPPSSGTTTTPQPVADTSPHDAAAQGPVEHVVTLPFFLGQRTASQFRRLFAGVLLFSLPVAVGTIGYQSIASNSLAQKLVATSTMTSDMRYLAKAADLVLNGNAAAKDQLHQRADALDTAGAKLRQDSTLARILPVSEEQSNRMGRISKLIAGAQRDIGLVADSRDAPADASALLHALQNDTAAYAENLSAIARLKPTGPRPPAEQAEWDAVAAMAALSRRWVENLRIANQVQGVVAQMPDALAAFGQREQALAQATSGQGARATTEPPSAPLLATLMQNGRALSDMAQKLQAASGAIAQTREAAQRLDAASDQMDQEVKALQATLLTSSADSGTLFIVALLSSGLSLMSLVGLLYVKFSQKDYQNFLATNARQEAALRLQWAESAAEDARQANQTNQLAIFRLMQELQDIADGDLTKRVTVSEDLTGGIADAINYTVEELHELVLGVQRTAAQVESTTSRVDSNSMVLLESSHNQLTVIHKAGESVLRLAAQVGAISAQAQSSATVARQSRTAADSGLAAVQDAISSTQHLREQIHETSKRIKRLGESSQEIGEITGLISEITTQTNVLAANAAIQAASAGESGRGFSVVSEEVVQLAERSANAARQITALVSGIQTDAHNAMNAMERVAQDVVEGTRLSDRAGLALTDIDRLSQDVALQIENISAVATRESETAGVIAQDIREVFAVVEKTAQGTRSNAETVRSLKTAANELKNSVARFRVVA